MGISRAEHRLSYRIARATGLFCPARMGGWDRGPCWSAAANRQRFL
jgi:hypothetical protein